MCILWYDIISQNIHTRIDSKIYTRRILFSLLAVNKEILKIL